MRREVRREWFRWITVPRTARDPNFIPNANPTTTIPAIKTGIARTAVPNAAMASVDVRLEAVKERGVIGIT